MSEQKRPLVSIIVRTKDRPKLLKRALESIAAQTYRPIEVVLVNDGGGDLEIDKFREILGNISLNYIRLEKNMGRAHAGNVGIENAVGKYIGFLDDDDEFYPEHTDILVSFSKKGDYDVAYSAIELVENTYDNAGGVAEKRKKVFASSFSYSELLLGNYIPLMSVLFRANLIKRVRFDENFELYEDWDMLIRMADKTSFYFVNSITAKYNQWGYAQINYKPTPEKLKEATVMIYSKHWHKIPPLYLFELRQDSAKVHERAQTIEAALRDKIPYLEYLQAAIENQSALVREKDRRIWHIEERIAQLKRTAREQEAYIDFIHSGHGWALLTKYYRLRDRLLPPGTARRAAAKIAFNAPFLLAPRNVRKTMNDVRLFGFKNVFKKMGERLDDALTAPASAFPPDAGTEDIKSRDTRVAENQGPVVNLNSLNSQFLKSERPLRNRRLVPAPNLAADRAHISGIIGKMKNDLLNSFGEIQSRE